MRMQWERLRSNVTHFLSNKGRQLKYAYWTGAVLLVVFLFAFPLWLGYRSPNVVVLDPFHPNVIAARRRWEVEMLRARREQTRMSAFAVMVHELYENYPFFEAATRRSGLNYMEFALDVFGELMEIVHDDPAQVFIRDFINDYYLSYLFGLGNVRVAMQAGLIDWIHHPYFFNHYDWRFTDERHVIPVREDNVEFATLTQGVAYMRIHNFFAKGYEDVTRLPFWQFDPATQGQLLLGYFESLDNYEHLIIDVRGNANNFAGYFVPYILSPFLHVPMEKDFYAFHMGGYMARRVSYAYREWHNLGERVDADTLTGNFTYALPEGIVSGFPVPVRIQPAGDISFDGRVWLVVDSGSFSGPNFMYLQMAREAGFTIVYQEDTQSEGWDTTFVRLAAATIVLRFNPLYFTDAYGRSLEETGRVYDYRLPIGIEDRMDVWRFLEGV